MTILPYHDRSYVRFISDRSGETLFEIKMFDGAVLVWGSHYRPSEFDARLNEDGATVAIAGTLCDRLGPVVTFAACLNILCGFRVEVGRLPENFDPSWSRDYT